jgi:lipid-binding SYLF domain-containing protein
VSRIFKHGLVMIIGSALLPLLTGRSTTPRSGGHGQALSADADATLTVFRSTDPTLQPLLDKAVGYAVFPGAGEPDWIVGGSSGRGVLYEHGQPIGWAGIAKRNVGLQGGTRSDRHLVIFLTQDRMDAFKGESFTLSGNVSTVSLTAGAAATTDPSAGVISVVQTRGG